MPAYEFNRMREFIGTAFEITTVPTDDIGPGSTYWATDTRIGYIWDGSAWCEI